MAKGHMTKDKCRYGNGKRNFIICMISIHSILLKNVLIDLFLVRYNYSRSQTLKNGIHPMKVRVCVNLLKTLHYWYNSD